MKQLEGYAVAMLGGNTFIGKVNKEATAENKGFVVLEPVYEAHVQYEADQAGNFAIWRECVPVMGSCTLKRIFVPVSGAVIVPCEDLSAKERENWSKALLGAEQMVKVIRTAESGLVLATQDATKLPPPPGEIVR